jgi:hypothetical protein
MLVFEEKVIALLLPKIAATLWPVYDLRSTAPGAHDNLRAKMTFPA